VTRSNYALRVRSITSEKFPVSVRSFRRALALGVLTAVGSVSLFSVNPLKAQAATPITIAIPAYFTDDALWQKALDTPAVQYVIGHPLVPVAGQAYIADKDLAAHLAQAKAKGKIPLVYVTGGYDKVDWKVVADRIDTILDAYPAASGVFIDEINYDQCEKYTSLTKGAGTVKGVRTRQANKLIVLNPGAPLLNCYDGLADGYVTLERAEKDIPAWTENVNLAGNASAYAWMFKDESRKGMWQMVHSVAPANAAAAVDAAVARNASVLYLTDDTLPNPYDSLPGDATFKAVVDRVTQYSNGTTPLPVVKQLSVPKAGATVTTAAPGKATTNSTVTKKTTRKGKRTTKRKR
jgi:Spherulation-specific family 4